MRMAGRKAPAEALEQASHWLVRQGAEDYSAEEEHRFADWLQAHPEHRRAYARLQGLWQTLGQVQRDELRPRPQRRGTAALLSVGLLLLSAPWVPELWISLRADYVAERGGNREILLADGSHVLLESGSALRVRVNGQQRELEVLRGRALFQVARLPQGEGFVPFTVLADGHSATALGTRYQVERSGVETRVTVLESRVAVRCGDCRNSTAEAELGPGEMARMGYGSLDLGRAPAGADAWSDGMLAFDRQPFAVASDQLQRYLPQKILLLSRAAKEKLVSGTVDPARPEEALALLARGAGLQVSRWPGLIAIH